jgi:hypothetical protein
MNAKEKRGMFAYGMLGGMMPPLSKLGATFVANPETPLPALGFLLGLAIFAFLGGMVALMNTAPEHRQAIFAGIAAPAIIAGVLAGKSEADNAVRGNTAFLSFIQSAYAQSGATTATGAVSRVVVIKPEVSGGMPSSVSIPITARVSKGSATETVPVGSITSVDGPTAIAVPPGTGEILVSGKAVAVPSTGPTQIDLSVTTRPTFGGDLLWALGAARTYKVDGVTVKPEPR